MFIGLFIVQMACQLIIVWQCNNYLILLVLSLFVLCQSLTLVGLVQGDDGLQLRGALAALWLIVVMLSLMDSGPQLQHTLPNQPSSRVHDSPTRKQWCFTLHYQDLGVDITLPSELPPTMTYLVFQQELTPTTERPHLQGFVCFSSVVRFTQVRTRLRLQAWRGRR